MAHSEAEQPDVAVEAILWASRPEPDATWARRLEQRLLPPAPPIRRLRIASRHRAGLALASGLAALVVILSLAGVGPLGGRSDSVDARDGCRTVPQTTTERIPAVVEDGAGAPTLIYRERRVTRRVARCSPSARPRGAGGGSPSR